jgi:hypothetical protein
MVEEEKNTMYSVKDNDLIIQGTNNLLNHATEFYKKLFGPGEGNKMRLDSNIWHGVEKLL